MCHVIASWLDDLELLGGVHLEHLETRQRREDDLVLVRKLCTRRGSHQRVRENRVRAYHGHANAGGVLPANTMPRLRRGPCR